MSSPQTTLPVHIHVGPGACRHLGDLQVGSEADLSASLAAMLRTAADRMDHATVVLAEVEKIVQNASQGESS